MGNERPYPDAPDAETHVRAAVTKYYHLGGQRVALRAGGEVRYVLSDHLGSVSVASDAAGNEVGRQRYLPYGATRHASGSLPTDYGFTGQREEVGLGLYDYRARYYDPYVGRFVSADSETSVPGEM